MPIQWTGKTAANATARRQSRDSSHHHPRHQRHGRVDLLDVLGHPRGDVAAARGLEDVRVELKRVLHDVLAERGRDGDAELLGDAARESQQHPGGERGGDEPRRQPEHRVPGVGGPGGDGVDDPAEQQGRDHRGRAGGHVEDDREGEQTAAFRDGAPEHRGGPARGRGGEDPSAHRSTSSA
jgi:hypothetical protein